MNELILQTLASYARQHGESVTAFNDKHDMVVRFHLGPTPFEGRIKYVPPKTWEIFLSFHVPQIQQRFFIESKRNWFPEKSGCARIRIPPLDSKYKLHCSDEIFFRAILSRPNLIEHLMGFPEDSVDHLKIYLKDGYLMAKWRFMFSSQRAIRDQRDEILPNRFAFLTDHLLLYYFGLRPVLNRGNA